MLSLEWKLIKKISCEIPKYFGVGIYTSALLNTTACTKTFYNYQRIAVAFSQRNHSRFVDNNYGNNNSFDVVVDNNDDWHGGANKDKGFYYFAARERDMQIA